MSPLLWMYQLNLLKMFLSQWIMGIHQIKVVYNKNKKYITFNHIPIWWPQVIKSLIHLKKISAKTIEEFKDLLLNKNKDIDNYGKYNLYIWTCTNFKKLYSAVHIWNLILFFYSCSLVLEVRSRLDADPGNHGGRKCLITNHEAGRQVSPPENLCSSLNTLKQLFRISKDGKHNPIIETIIKKTQLEERDGSILTSSFTLLAEGYCLKVIFHFHFYIINYLK